MNFPADVFQEFNVVAIPTRTSYRGIALREAVLFRGTQGWSEFSPFVEYDDAESASWLNAAVEAAYTAWPKSFRELIPINATLPQVEVDQVPKILDAFTGCSTIKIKVSDFEVGSELVEASLEHIPDAKIRLDVNGKWTLEQALEYLYQYHLRFGPVFEYIEQPCEAASDLAKLRREIPIKIAVDESIRKHLADDFSELNHFADIAILKWQPIGGFDTVHEIASRVGLPVVISSALETGVGISHGLALAASFPKLDFACGLGTVALLESDICEPALIPANGELEVMRVEPSERLLKKYAASDERLQWWKNRVSRIWEVRR